MFSTLMVTFREGVEAFLVIAVTMMYLKNTGREHLIAPMRLGVVVAVVGSSIFGVVLAHAGAMSPVYEGWLALAAFGLVASCTVHMIKNGRRIAADIRTRIETSEDKHPSAAKVAVFLFVLLMIGREGVETATMLASIALRTNSQDVLIGGVIGTCCAGVLSIGWTRYGQKVNLAKFFQLTTIFMVLFSVQLGLYAFHEFTEGGVMPVIDNARWHVLTEPFGPDGVYGTWLSYSLGLVPLGFLAISALMRRFQHKGTSSKLVNS